MPIPDFRLIILPLLKLAGDQDEHHRRTVVDILASQFHLTDEEREQVTEKRRQNAFDNRCDFALNFLRSNGLLISTKRGSFRITERGLAALKNLNQSPEEIEDAFSKPSAKIIDYLNQKWPVEDEDNDDQTPEESTEDEDNDDQTPEESIEDEDNDDQTPEESIEENYQKIREDLASELLQKIKDNSPAFFEELVIDLLFKMGYGGSREDAQAVGRSGDGGIDGIIKADPLGLNVVYIQAKRWEGNVGAPPIRDFVGALDGEGVQDGIFITTSNFNPAAEKFAERSSKRVILINGSQLADFMIDHNVGVSTTKTYEIKRVDSDYFAEATE